MNNKKRLAINIQKFFFYLFFILNKLSLSFYIINNKILTRKMIFFSYIKGKEFEFFYYFTLP